VNVRYREGEKVEKRGGNSSRSKKKPEGGKHPREGGRRKKTKKRKKEISSRSTGVWRSKQKGEGGAGTVFSIYS